MTANIDQLKQEEVADWNAARGPKRLEELARARATLDSLVWPWDADLSRQNFWKAQLDGVDLAFAVLQGSVFDGASLNDAVLDYARANDVSFSHTRLNGGSLYRGRFQGANFNRTHLRGADLRFADFTRANLAYADLRDAKLIRANFENAVLEGADLRGADLSATNFAEADMYRADLRGCDLGATFFRSANLRQAKLADADLRTAMLDDANLREADLTGADLSGGRLRYTTLVETKVQDADFSGAHIFGMSAWDLVGDPASARDLNIAGERDPVIRIDDLEVAQFVYLLLHNEKIRKVIDTVTAKAVLILGRFTDPRKAVLDALRERLRELGFVPMVFDFDRPVNRNLTETVTTLAQLSRFVIADITDAKSIPQELQKIVPGLPSLPVQPIIQDDQFEYGMFEDFLDYPWVLLPYRYQDTQSLLDVLKEKVIAPAESKAAEVIARRAALRATRD